MSLGITFTKIRNGILIRKEGDYTEDSTYVATSNGMARYNIADAVIELLVGYGITDPEPEEENKEGK